MKCSPSSATCSSHRAEAKPPNSNLVPCPRRPPSSPLRAPSSSANQSHPRTVSNRCWVTWLSPNKRAHLTASDRRTDTKNQAPIAKDAVAPPKTARNTEAEIPTRSSTRRLETLPTISRRPRNRSVNHLAVEWHSLPCLARKMFPRQRNKSPSNRDCRLHVCESRSPQITLNRPTAPIQQRLIRWKLVYDLPRPQEYVEDLNFRTRIDSNSALGTHERQDPNTS